MNLPSLYTLQGLHQLKFLLGHLRAQDKTCKLILIAHGTLQLTIGITINFLNLPIHQTQILGIPSWLLSVWQFMDSLHIKIDIAQARLPPTPQGNDINLIDYVLAKGMVGSELLSFNRCGLYLQLLNLSDMTSADGSCLIPQVLQGCCLTDRRSTLSWPIQQLPTKADWLVWSTAFHSLSSGGILSQPINMSSRSSHQEWLLFLDSGLNLFQSSGSKEWMKCSSPNIRMTRHSLLRFCTSTAQATLAPSPPLFLASSHRSSLTTMQVTRGHALPALPSDAPSTAPLQPLEQPTGFTTHPFYSHLLGNLTFTDTQWLQMAEALQQDTLLACSDGSYDPITQSGAYGMVFGTETGPILRGSGPCSGHPSQFSAIRSELCSICASALGGKSYSIVQAGNSSGSYKMTTTS
jgi:hypothetical protein